MVRLSRREALQTIGLMATAGLCGTHHSRSNETGTQMEDIAKTLASRSGRFVRVDGPALLVGTSCSVLAEFGDEVRSQYGSVPEKHTFWTTGRSVGIAGDHLMRDIMMCVKRLACDSIGERHGRIIQSALSSTLVDFAAIKHEDSRDLPLEISVSGFTYSSSSLLTAKYGAEDTFVYKIGSDPTRRALNGAFVEETDQRATVSRCTSVGLRTSKVYGNLFVTLPLKQWRFASDCEKNVQGNQACLSRRRSTRRAGEIRSSEERVSHLDYAYQQDLIAPMVMNGVAAVPGIHLGCNDIRVRATRYRPGDLDGAKPFDFALAERISLVLRRSDASMLQVFTNMSSADAYWKTNPGTREMVDCFHTVCAK